MKRLQFLHIGLLAYFSFVVCSALFGQATSSTLSGVVRDPSQAVVAGAVVTVTNTGTGANRTAQTDAGGRYRLGELQPGNYQVNVTNPGFTSLTRKDIVLQVGQELSLNFALEVGSVEQQVEVTASAPVVETTTATVSGGVTQEQLRELPLNGRSFTDLVTLQAGTVAPSSAAMGSNQNGNAPQLSVSGARPDANNFMIDGTDVAHATGFTPGGAAGVQLGVDTIREYQVITSNAKAEYGRNSGGIINAVSRSGTNQLHGSAFEFLRNSALDARNFFDKAGVPPFKRNQFGATLGGPIHKDQSFFFFGYEGLRERLAQTFTYNVPTAPARQGIGILGAGQAVDPRVIPYLNLIPQPNGAILGGGVGNYLTTVSQPTGENYGSARVDHNFSSNDFLFGRYTIDRGERTSELNLLTRITARTANQYVTMQEDHIFSSTVLNTFRVGLNRTFMETILSDVPGAPLSLGFVAGQPMGQISIGGLSPFGPSYLLNPIYWANTTFQYDDNLTVSRGPHTLKLGATIERFRWNTDGSLIYRGQFTFNNLSNFLQAGPSGTGITVLLPGSISYRHFRDTLLGFFVQDDYKLTPSFTLNYGLRWEFTTGVSETDNLETFLKNGPITSTFNDLGRGEFWKNHIGMVAPRLGFNWALGPEQKSSVSGGFGVYYNQILSNGVITYRVQQPFYRRANGTNLNATRAFPNVVQIATDNNLLSRESRHFDYDNFKTPTYYRYNLAIQQALPAQMGIRLGYVGAIGRHIQREQFLNTFPAPVVQGDGSLFFPPTPVPQKLNPEFDDMPFMSSDANSTYNALQISLNKRFSAGLLFQANYTWSKSIDDYSNNDSTIDGVSRRGQYGPDRTLERGLSLFNVPNVFVFNGIYELPIGSGKRFINGGGVASALLGAWQVGGILTLQQGVPFTALSNATTAGYRVTAARPNLKVGTDVPSLTNNGTPERYFDPTAFTVPTAGTLGNAARGLMLGPPLSSINFSLSKAFQIREATNLQFRGEFFNVLNHANFANPNGTVFTSTSGVINPSAGQITRTSTTARQIQLALKLTF
jgi:hypothetical protein